MVVRKEERIGKILLNNMELQSRMNILFIVLCIVHLLIWAFILFAFLNKRYAYINLFYVIPIIYIIHILPFHSLVEIKKLMYPSDYKEKVEEVEGCIPPLKLWKTLHNTLEKFSFQNPMSVQGMMIFGILSSGYALKGSIQYAKL